LNIPNKQPDEPAGLYVHIPFCLQKCSYCDFYSITDPSLHQAFLEALMIEMNLKSGFALTFDSLYIGGGTPSVFGAETIARIVEAAHRSFNILKDAEITLEVNPDTITPEKLEGFRRAGVNRINIGVQSFNPENLIFLDRLHSYSDADIAGQWAREAGFENICLDLIYGIPGQTKKAWVADLERALRFEPEHLSCYRLTYEPGTSMDKSRQKGRFHPLNDDKISDLFTSTIEFLAGRGYAQYEMSSFASTGSGRIGQRSFERNRSRHNRKYWSFTSYLGLGPSAHSFKEPERSWNRSDVPDYINELAAGRLPPSGREMLSRSQLMMEAIYLGLRQTEGININAFEEKFGVNFHQRFIETLRSLEERGLIGTAQNRCALTRKGMLYLDSITSMLANQV
jgi:oxygen-independent coproporphyrinogen-3 oxidase